MYNFTTIDVSKGNNHVIFVEADIFYGKVNSSSVLEAIKYKNIKKQANKYRV